MRHQWAVVGAGLVGCTIAERIASGLEQRVLVVEARDHVGGNVFDELDEHGILVHRYGPHAFHTNDEGVWKYLSRFTDWRSYEHHVLARIDRQLVPLPFNFNSLDALFSQHQAADVRKLLLEHYGPGQEIPILRLREEPEMQIRKFADFVYEKIFYGYTLKQWSLTPEQLGRGVMGRVPVRLSRDDRYFRDRYQGIPALGYTTMVHRMLSHRNIEVLLGTTFESVRDVLGGCRLIYTGPMDSYFEHIYGPLPYRSLRFEIAHEAVKQHQSVAQINYPNEHQYTRIIEHKHITGQEAEGTTITREYPQPHQVGKNEPYYPIPLPENLALQAKYAAEAAKLGDTVLFAGRLADYRYYNMDQAVARALSLFEREIAPLRAKGTQSVSQASTKGQPADPQAAASVDQVASLISDLRPSGIAAMVPRAALLNFRIARAIGMIELDYSIPQLNLDLISQRVGLTKSYLCRIFKRELGIGLPEYVSKVRAQAAAELLRETCLSIKEITAAVGLTHVTQLDRAFRVTYGCVPKVYRSRISARSVSRSL